MQRMAVVDVVGLTRGVLAVGVMPRLAARAARSGIQSFRPAFPAVTATVQASMWTGLPVARHGVVGNGWYDRESGEVRFWRQGNRLVHGPRVWEELRRRRPGARCANLFWWFNMHTSADLAVTPRPLYPADGRKVFDIHTQPMDLRERIQGQLGAFPFPAFWGPLAGIESSRWIAEAARWIERTEQPELLLAYLPHLDYDLQRFGPADPRSRAAMAAIDDVAGPLADDLEAAGMRVLVVSEYGITPVSRPVHLNRLFRERGWLALKDELGREALVPGDSAVIAVADHQVAHVYVRNPALVAEAKALVAATAGVAEVRDGGALWGCDGPAAARGGDFVAVAEPDAWFTYYHWHDDAVAPDFARTVDIHRKPGYDPAELFIDPTLHHPKLRVLRHLARVRLGLRSLLELVPLDATLVGGSHGRDEVPEDEQPVAIGAHGPVTKPEDLFGEMAGTPG